MKIRNQKKNLKMIHIINIRVLGIIGYGVYTSIRKKIA